jgi:hypothetical protein
LVLAPGYFRRQMTAEVLYRYFSTLADAARLPILLYNAPGFNGLALEPELVGRLAAHPNIVGIKDSASSGIRRTPGLRAPRLRGAGGLGGLPPPGPCWPALRQHGLTRELVPEVALRLYEYGRARRAEVRPIRST